MQLKIDDVPVNSLAPNPWNTNEMTPENERKLENSLKRFGFTRPLLVRTLADGSLQLLGGEHRWGVAKRLGFKTVPIINLGTVDDQRAKEIGLVDNGRYGEDDTVKLAELLKGMGDAGDLLDILPMTGNELEDLFAASDMGFDDLDIPDSTGDLPDLATAKTGPTHVVMRFKVPIGDSQYVERLVDSTMKAQGYTTEDSLSNAGHALLHLLRGL